MIRPKALDYTIYLLIRVAVAILQGIPVSWAFRASEGLAWLGFRLDRRHRNVALENLRHAFPEKSEIQLGELVRSCYRHFARLVIEIILLPRKLKLENWRRSGQLVNGGPMINGMAGERAVLTIAAHYGNWEFAGYALGAFGFRSHTVARVLDNPYLETFFKKFRQATGQQIIAKKQDFHRLEQVLRDGGKVAMLADQDAGPRGVFVDFFGRPASAHKAVALMAMEFDTKLVVIGMPRTMETATGSYFEITCEDEIDPRDYAGRPDAVHAITQRYHAALERLIRRHPEQYFWLHRRWKTAPAVRKKLAIAA